MSLRVGLTPPSATGKELGTGAKQAGVLWAAFDCLCQDIVEQMFGLLFFCSLSKTLARTFIPLTQPAGTSGSRFRSSARDSRADCSASVHLPSAHSRGATGRKTNALSQSFVAASHSSIRRAIKSRSIGSRASFAAWRKCVTAAAVCPSSAVNVPRMAW
jgi:hypothetical protein